MPVSQAQIDAAKIPLYRKWGRNKPKRIEINASGFDRSIFQLPKAGQPENPQARSRLVELDYEQDPYTRYFMEGQPQIPRAPVLNNTYLRPNARFFGKQQSGSSRYAIQVELKTVDLESSVVTGFFQISGLTDEHPLITTCFKGEIINNPLQRSEWGSSGSQAHKRYSFITEENNWSSFPKNDLEHWKKLTGCPNSFSEADLRERLRHIQMGEQDPSYIYMRWKEEFLLPDSRVKQLTGASFEGFYYIVLNMGSGPQHRRPGSKARIAPGSMNGLYFYTQSEKFQSLSLKYVDERKGSSAFDFA